MSITAERLQAIYWRELMSKCYGLGNGIYNPASSDGFGDCAGNIQRMLDRLQREKYNISSFQVFMICSRDQTGKRVEFSVDRGFLRSEENHYPRDAQFIHHIFAADDRGRVYDLSAKKSIVDDSGKAIELFGANLHTYLTQFIKAATFDNSSKTTISICPAVSFLQAPTEDSFENAIKYPLSEFTSNVL